jgi:D-alanine--poly(phosphoribitol) ligase subunit 2
MSEERATVIAKLRVMLVKLAGELGHDASAIDENELIPDTGLLDSASLIDFVMQIDTAYGLALEAEDMTIDNFGTLAAIANFVASRRR